MTDRTHPLRRRAALAGLLLLGACGPTRLAPLAGPPKGRVILLRGLANMFSTGLNVLTAELRAAGYDASVHNHVEWPGLADQTLGAARSGALPRPLALIGHSFGADDAIRMAARLGREGLESDLLVTFDPTAVTRVPPGPRKVVNFHQDLDPIARVLEPGAGFAATLENRRVDGESHLSIEKSPRLHADVLALLDALRAPAPPPPAPAAAAPPRPARLPLPPRPPLRAG
jgi:hypothetical protein